MPNKKEIYLPIYNEVNMIEKIKMKKKNKFFIYSSKFYFNYFF
jgi:hypothetical protein